MPRSRVVVRRALAVLVVLTVSIPLVPPAGAQEPTHQPPVDAPVVDPFRPPLTRFGPGNRGIEYGTDPGTEVRATADGVVVFAGAVGPSRHVTVRHPDGVKTSYSFLSTVAVVVGQRLRQGEVVGTTEGHLHLGARIGDAYFDPAALFAGSTATVRLVPFDDLPGFGSRGERSAIGQLIGGIGGALGSVGEGLANRVLDSTGATVGWLRENGAQLLRTAGHYLEPLPIRLARTGYGIWTTAQGLARRPCTESGVAAPPPPGRRLAVTVGGLGSTSRGAGVDAVDTEALGYRSGDVTRFSYAGGRVPGTGQNLPGIPESGYEKADTQADLRESAVLLADLIEAVVDRAEPGVPVDVYAHSQGGVVTRLALVELQRRHGLAWLDRIDEVVMLAVPNSGSDLATGIYAVGSTERGSQAFDVLGVALGLDDDAQNVAQLAETSDLMAELARTPLPEVVDAVSIGARGDLVVPLPRTRVDGAASVAVPLDGPSAHGDLPGSAEGHREMALALADMPPTCQTLQDGLVAGAVGEGISLVEDHVSSLAWIYTGLRSGGKPLGG